MRQSDERRVEIKEIKKMKQTNNILNGGRIKKYFFFFCFQLWCTIIYIYSKVDKKCSYTTIIATPFLYMVALKVVFYLFSATIVDAVMVALLLYNQTK